MTYDELLKEIDANSVPFRRCIASLNKALRAVVELHKPSTGSDELPPCLQCGRMYPCPTIQAIEKGLK